MSTFKAAYTHQELADLSGLSRWQVRRLVEQKGLEVLTIGRRELVPLVAFRDAFPKLWASIVLRLQLGTRR